MPASSPSIRPSEKPENPDFRAELLALIPFLRAFARSLTGNQEGADDLAQETLVKAWQSRSTFIPGTNLKAWL
ncbi:MAG TPA: sigma factor, partial [Rhizomicrobium sp.]|nr:sigma factor [Rhizomicrobium sp.]